MYSTPLDHLSPRLRELWREWVEARQPEVGPFLHPDFVAAVASVRDGVEVAVIEEEGEVRGFLPFRRGPWGIARPVAGRLCDQAGAVLRPGAAWSPTELARAAGLRAIRLANAPTADPALRPYQSRPKRILYLDLSEGFEAYRKRHLESGSRFHRQIESRIRKAERALGPLRFQWQTYDETVLDTLLAWKSAQRRRTGSPDVFDLPWARTLVERLRPIRSRSFEGVLSAVYFGDTLAAAHLGVRSSAVLQYWVPGYDPELHRFSPGLACLVAVAREGTGRGIRRIDMGVGEQRFKVQACNGTREVATATVRRDPAVGALLDTVDSVRAWARESSERDLIQRATRAVARGSYRARSLLR